MLLHAQAAFATQRHNDVDITWGRIFNQISTSLQRRVDAGNGTATVQWRYHRYVIQGVGGSNPGCDIKIFYLQCRLYFTQIVSIFFKVVKLLFFMFSFKIFYKISTTNSNNMHKNSRRNDATDHQSCYWQSTFFKFPTANCKHTTKIYRHCFAATQHERCLTITFCYLATTHEELWILWAPGNW